MPDPSLRFVLNGERIDASGVPPTTTLLQYLRNDRGLHGTKEGCAEGDCGACTVLVGELRAEGIAYTPVNACIRFLPTLDGKSVLTVDGVKGPKGLHPVQRAMVDCHGSQCGFCTPGFVMSLLGLYLRQEQAGESQIGAALSGNLCRCTGYRPILAAGERMRRYPDPEHWSRADAQSPARRRELESIQRTDALEISAGSGYCAPRTLDALADRYAAQPDALILAGGTDVGLWVTKHLRDLPPMIYLGDVAALKTIREFDGCLEIGAAVTLSDAFDALVGHYPMLRDFADRFASPPIRSSGTLCGNLANGSPIGDAMPPLIALGARVVLRKGARERELALDALYLDYRKNALEAGELLTAVRIPLPRPHTLFAAYKVAKRHDQDISAVCAAFCIGLSEGRVDSARVAYGGMAATPKRATHVEATLYGQPWSQATIDAAMAAMTQDYTPIGDMRASSSYRRRVAANLLARFFLEHREGAIGRSIGVFAIDPS